MVNAAAARPVAPAPRALRRPRFTSGERRGTLTPALKVIAFSGQTSWHLRQVMHSEWAVLTKSSAMAPIGQARTHRPQLVHFSETTLRKRGLKRRERKSRPQGRGSGTKTEAGSRRAAECSGQEKPQRDSCRTWGRSSAHKKGRRDQREGEPASEDPGKGSRSSKP